MQSCVLYVDLFFFSNLSSRRKDFVMWPARPINQKNRKNRTKKSLVSSIKGVERFRINKNPVFCLETGVVWCLDSKKAVFRQVNKK